MQSFILLTAVVALGGSPEGDAAKEQFLSAYEPAVTRNLARLSKNCRLTAHEQSFDGGKLVFDVDYEFLANDRCVLVKKTSRPPSGDTKNVQAEWHLLRPDGVFVVRSTARPGEYILKERRPGQKSVPEAGPPFLLMVSPFLRFNLFLLAHIRSPDVRVVTYGETVLEDVSLKLLKVEERINKFSSNTSYYFDPAEWMLDSYTIEPKDGKDKVSIRFRYKTIDGERHLNRAEVNSISRDGKSTLRGFVDYRNFERATPPDSEFSLERFGLPESVNFASRKQVPAYTWILGAAAGCAFLAVMFRLLARRVRVARTT
jgi:hypothetical protein